MQERAMSELLKTQKVRIASKDMDEEKQPIFAVHYFLHSMQHLLVVYSTGSREIIEYGSKIIYVSDCDNSCSR